MSEPSAIGRRLKGLRVERNMTQAELAERAEVSLDLVSKLEQGTRQSVRLTSLTRLATGLDVELCELVDVRPRLDRGDDSGGFLAVRDALLSPADLPWIDPREDTGDPTEIAELERVVGKGWEDYWAGRFGHLAGTLPGMIAEARVTARVLGAEASRPLAQSYQLAACLLVHMGKTDIAAIGAERALNAAGRGDDELQWATLHGTYAWVLLNQGRLAESERHAARIADHIEPVLTRSRPRPEELTVWGGLMLTAMAPAAAAGRRVEAGDCISLARASAARLPGERHDYQVSFGPTQVATQATHAYTVLGEPEMALRMARDVQPSDLIGISYGRHLLDVGQAQVDARRHDDAVTTLERARVQSPEWFRHQRVARAVVSELVAHHRRLTPTMSRLVRAAGAR